MMDTSSANPLLTAALAYAVRGWYVFPCHTPTTDGCSCRRDCGSIGKHPRTQHGLRDASVDTTTIRRWWTMWPTANIGIVTGAIDGLVVLDEDSYKGGDESLHTLEQSYNPLPKTVQQLTGGGGVQYLFAHPGTPVKNGVETLGIGLDIRGDGGYVIAPPSLHVSGKHYTWEVVHDPDETALAPMPPWLLALCQESTRRDTPSAGDPIPKGHRNQRLFTLACSFRARGCTEAVILGALEVMNRTQCLPPLDDAQIATIAASSAKYDAGPVPTDMPMIRSVSPLPPPLCPPLSRDAALALTYSAGAAPWLEAYCDFSRQWAPRSAAAFHEAVGLWVLATVAARRICVEFGDPIFPVLFLSLAAESTIYTKSTAVAQGETLLRHTGLSFLLTPDHSTPQALIRNMGGRVPVEYAKATEEEQAELRQKLAFSGQRGWYYAEWGGMLNQMHRTDSPMTMFHELIRRLDDDKATFSSETIQRGLEHIDSPYLSLLTSSTPYDLAPFMKTGEKWWHDGFWPRFAFIVPEGPPVTTRRPQGRAVPPSWLIRHLRDWHDDLGVPEVTVEEARDKHDRGTGEYRLARSPFPQRVYAVDADAEEAYVVYGETMWTMPIEHDLIPSYARLPHKALRIALLLASVQGAKSVTLAHWAYAQTITEHWRAMLHQAITMIGATAPMSRDAQTEETIERILAQEGPQTLRLLQRRLHIESAVMKRLTQSMEYTGRACMKKQGKSVYIYLPQDADVEAPAEQQEEQNDVSF